MLLGDDWLLKGKMFLIVGDLNELLQVGDTILGDYSRSNYIIIATDKEPIKVVQLVTTADPQGSGPDDEFGFSENRIEFPNTL